MIITSNTKMFFNFREDLVLAIKNKGYDVSVVVPQSGYEKDFERIGAKGIAIDMNKNTTSILKNIKYIFTLKKIIKEENPDIVFSYTIKPIILGSIAAKMANINKIYSMVTGMGHVYEEDVDFKTKIIRFICGIGYKIAFKFNKRVIFQNKDDINEVVERHYLPRNKCFLVDGSGVNMKKFSKTELPQEDVFIMISRVLKSKGVKEYFEAARMVKDKYPKTSFLYVGRIDATSYALTYDMLKEYVDDGTIEYIPETDDVFSYLKNARYFVLPSWYREGIPRALLEALATAKPIITTDSYGCREVINGKNGLLVKPRDIDDLYEKMLYMIEHKKEVMKMSEESYKYCKERFEISLINKQMLKALDIK